MLSVLRAPPISILMFPLLTSPRKDRRLVGVGLLLEVADRAHFPGARLPNLRLVTRQQIMGLAVVQARPERDPANLDVYALNDPLLVRYVPSCPRKVPPPSGSVPTHVLATVAVTSD